MADQGLGTTTRPRARPARLAGGLLNGAGLIGIVAGLAAVTADPYVTFTGQGAHHHDLAGWAWLYLGTGVLSALAGLTVLTVGRRAVRTLAIACALLSIVVGLLFLGYQPLSSLLVVGLAATALRLLLLRDRPANRR